MWKKCETSTKHYFSVKIYETCVLNPGVSSYAENDCEFVSLLSEGKKSVIYWHFCVFSKLETDHFRILEQVGYWKHHIQISALFLVLLENPERRRYKNGANKKSHWLE